MKKKLFPMAALLLTGGMCASCNFVKNTQPEDRLQTELCEIQKTDGQMSYNAKLDYPVDGPSPLVDSIRAALGIAVGDSVQATGEDFRSILNQRADAFLAEARNEAEELKADFPDYVAANSFETECRLTDNAPGYVTYSSKGYAYTGGAHGMPWNFGWTFERKTGRVLQARDIFKNPADTALGRIVCEALLGQYYAVNVPDYRPQFAEAGTVALPGASPLLTSRGVRLCYSAYEIGPYSDGMPECVISYDTLQPYLTDACKALLEGAEEK